MKAVYIPIKSQKIKGTLFYPDSIKPSYPAVLFLHGWSTGEKNYIKRAEGVAAQGAI